MADEQQYAIVTFVTSENMAKDKIKVLCHPDLVPYIQDALVFLKEALDKKQKRGKKK